MIRYKNTVWTLLTLLFSLSSCTSFLDENPNDRLVTKNFYKSSGDAQASVDAVYNVLYSIYHRNIFLLCDLPTDGMKNGLGMPNPYLQDLEFLRHNSENTFIRDMWKDNYDGIMRANEAINNIPLINMEQEIKDRLIGEAKFLRALYYFNLVRFWGDVPLILKLDNIEDAKGKRVPKDEIYNQIISDLKDAVSVLPLRYDTANEGRATQGAAKILLGKVYLTNGEYEQANQVLRNIIEHENEYGYGLQEDYAANWNPATEAGKEAVFYIEFKPQPLEHNSEMGMIAPKYSIPEYVGVAGSNEADIPTIELYNAYGKGDKRRGVNFRTEYTNPVNGHKITSSIPLFSKYYQKGILSDTQCEINIHIIRYSDALLSYAEALNEVGKTTQAIALLNRVRERAYGNTTSDYHNLSQSEFKNVLLNERWLEFPLEGLRWFDLVRMGKFIERMKAHSRYEANIAEKNKVDIEKNLKDYMILMPIPQHELDLNKNLTQNPGWN